MSQRKADAAPPQRLTLTVSEAAERLGISESLVRESLIRHELPGWKLGDRWLIPIGFFEQKNQEAIEQVKPQDDGDAW